jgi:predicted alpha/beta superfamily hydrolase
MGLLAIWYRGWMRWIGSLSVVLLGVGCGSDPDRGGSPPPIDAAASRDARPSDATAAHDAREDAPAVDAGASPFEEALALLEDPAADAAALDAMIYEVAWGAGWPLREGDAWLFVTRWDDAPETVALVSDLNAWSLDADPASLSASGVHVYAVVDAGALEAPAAGAKYKWYGAPDVYRAPPEATAYGYDEHGAFGYVAPPRDEAHLERFPALSTPHLDHPRTLRARLPAGFIAGSNEAARARVLLLHDGQNVFSPDAPHGGWRAGEALSAGGYDDVVALAIDSVADRFDAYTHTPDRLGLELVGGRADDYLALVRDEVLPFFRARYGVEAAGDSLVLAGSSLGGLVTLYAALTHPELAGCVIAMSSSLGWGSFEEGRNDTLRSRWDAHLPVTLYLDSGGGGTCADADGAHDDSDNYCVTLEMRDHLAGLGYQFETDLFHWWEPGAPHAESAWAARLPRALDACDGASWRAP